MFLDTYVGTTHSGILHVFACCCLMYVLLFIRNSMFWYTRFLIDLFWGQCKFANVNNLDLVLWYRLYIDELFFGRVCGKLNY